jgi:hypothetical protein
MKVLLIVDWSNRMCRIYIGYGTKKAVKAAGLRTEGFLSKFNTKEEAAKEAELYKGYGYGINCTKNNKNQVFQTSHQI